jgi:hypothetical protein
MMERFDKLPPALAGGDRQANNLLALVKPFG